MNSIYLFAVVLCLALNYDLVNGSLSRYRFKQHNVEHILNTRRDLPPAQWYNQRLDHFDESNTQTWQQRYWVNDTFFTGDGPVFIMIGGEGEENPLWMVEGQWINYAQKFNALCVMLEHRFYGRSRPTPDMSVENLVYLNSRQALADLASFRQHIHSGYNLDDENKWISFGGSYPGSLSAWFRLKYPHLVHAAVASSAPMFAIIDFTDYLVVVNNSLTVFSPHCSQVIQQATAQVQDLMQTQGGKSTLERLFSTCDPIETDDDVTNFYSSIAGNFENVVQYNRDNRAFEGAVDSNVTIDVVCDIMTSNIGDPLSRYATLNSLILQTYSQKCLDASYQKSIDVLKETSWNSSASVGGRQWFWQTCIEFGYYQSTDSQDQPFGSTFPVDFFTKQCEQVFGPQFDIDSISDAVNNTNTEYGGYDYEGTRVLFVNGEIDPWHALSFHDKAPNQYTKTAFIKGTAHCADMYPSGDADPVSLRAAREYTETMLQIWLNYD